jgi:oxygen-dependent protoporphyrinogen oxidase
MGSTIVIGAGATGLALGWRLAREKYDVVVLEAAGRAGGVVRSVIEDDCVLEEGPQALQTSSRASIRALLALGLREQVVEASPAARRRFILWDGQLREVPRALLDRSFFPFGALFRVLREPFVGRADIPGETVHEFVTRRFGPVAAERLADPFIAGVFGGDSRQLDVAAAFPELVRLEKEHGSVLRGGLFGKKTPAEEGAPKATFTFKRGMETLTAALAAELGDRLRLATPVEQIEVAGKGLRVHAPGGPYEAENVVVCATPSRAAAFLPELAAELADMPASRLAAVHLGWRGAPEKEGFGWLAPSSQRQDVLGCLWVSATFPPHANGRRLVRVMMGGPRDPSLPDRDDEALIANARRAVLEIEGQDGEPDLVHVVRASIPQYAPGHPDRVARLNAAIPGLRFLGWGYGGIGVEPGIRAALG